RGQEKPLPGIEAAICRFRKVSRQKPYTLPRFRYYVRAASPGATAVAGLGVGSRFSLSETAFSACRRGRIWSDRKPWRSVRSRHHSPGHFRPMHSRLAFSVALIPFALAAQQQPSAALRPITFLDRQLQRTVGSPTPSPDGKWLLYVLSTPDWSQAKSQSDIYLVSVKDRLASTRQMTFTKDKNETSPRWSRDGKFFVFLSNRDAASPPSAGASASATGENQIFMMRPDGGEARRITEAKEGVSTLAFSRDGKWLVYRSGKTGEEQLYALPVANIDSAKPLELTHQQTGVGLWKWSPDSRRIYFITADTLDKDEELRKEKKFNVVIRN